MRKKEEIMNGLKEIGGNALYSVSEAKLSVEVCKLEALLDIRNILKHWKETGSYLDD